MAACRLRLFFPLNLLSLHRHSNTSRPFRLLFEYSLVLFPENSGHGLNFFLLSGYPRDGIGIFTKRRLVDNRAESLLEDTIQIFLSLFHIMVINIVCIIIITNHCRYHPLPPQVSPSEDSTRRTSQTTTPPWMPPPITQAEIVCASPKLHFFILLSYRSPQSTALYAHAPSVFDAFSTRYWQFCVRFVFWPESELILDPHCIYKLRAHRIFRLC